MGKSSEEKQADLTLEYASVPTLPGHARIGPFQDLIEANLTQSRLLDSGIESEILNENQSALLGPIYGAAYGGLYLQVLKQNEDAARDLVREIEAIRAARINRDLPKCPRCNRQEIDRVIPMIRWIGFAAAFMSIFSSFGPIDPDVWKMSWIVIGITFLVWKVIPEWKCRVCRRRFKAAEPDSILDD